MIIRAIFTGSNSLGYEKGKEYKLKVVDLQVQRLDDTGKCPYKSLVAFLKNWSDIQVVSF